MSRQEFELKTAADIRRMRVAGLATAAALAAVRAAIRPGITTLELDAIAEATIVAHGGRSNFKLVPGYHHTICASINDEVVHGIPGNRELRAGDLVSIDCGAEIDGWNGDSAISVIVPDTGASGDLASREGRERLSAVTERALWVGIAALAGAEHLNEVGRAIESFVEEQAALHRTRYGILDQYVGHGIGRSMHEDPPVYNYAVRHDGPRVAPGLCVAIEPMITAGSAKTKVLKDDWTVATKAGVDAAHWEHTVAVHESGIWVLTEPDGGLAKLREFGVTTVALD